MKRHSFLFVSTFVIVGLLLSGATALDRPKQDSGNSRRVNATSFVSRQEKGYQFFVLGFRS
jgi:hypothetical protein